MRPTIVDDIVQLDEKFRQGDFFARTGVTVQGIVLPEQHPNNPDQKLEGLTALVIHYTANEAPTATAENTVKNWYGRRWKVAVDDPKKTPLELNGADFGYGSTQLLFDMTGGVQALNLSSAAWACGDRRLPYTPEFRGQTPLAKYLCNNRQNYNTISIEMCNNDVIKNSDEDWKQTVHNTQQFVIWFIRELGVKLNKEFSLAPQTFTAQSKLSGDQILLLRHYDLTGKACPLPLIGPHQDEWDRFVQTVDYGISL